MMILSQIFFYIQDRLLLQSFKMQMVSVYIEQEVKGILFCPAQRPKTGLQFLQLLVYNICYLLEGFEEIKGHNQDLKF